MFEFWNHLKIDFSVLFKDLGIIITVISIFLAPQNVIK